MHNSIFSVRDPDKGYLFQVIAMLLANVFGLIAWGVFRSPCSMLIILAPGIIVAIVFSEFKYKEIAKISFKSGAIIALFFIFTLMIMEYSYLLIFFCFIYVFILFASKKTRYLISFAILPCSLAFIMPLGFESAVNRVVECFFSSFFALFSVFVIKEIFAKYRMRKILNLLLDEMNLLLTSLSSTRSLVKLSDDLRMNELILKSENLILKNRYFYNINFRYSKKMKIYFKYIIRIERTIYLFRDFKNEKNKSFVEEVKVILNMLNTAICNKRLSFCVSVQMPSWSRDDFSYFDNYFAFNVLRKELLKMSDELNSEFSMKADI